ncbi:hypothetical protein [Dichelobacter nodosus]
MSNSEKIRKLKRFYGYLCFVFNHVLVYQHEQYQQDNSFKFGNSKSLTCYLNEKVSLFGSKTPTAKFCNKV